MKWYRKAADQNYTKAQYILGFCYADGDSVKRIMWKPQYGGAKLRNKAMLQPKTTLEFVIPEAMA